MTNAELIAKIKAEIERRIIYAIGFRDNVEQEERASFFNGEAVALKHLLSFLDTLESEKPMNLEDAMKELDEKIALVTRRGTWDGVDVDKYMDEVRGRDSEKLVPADLEEAARKYQEGVPVDTTIHYCGADEDVYFANRIVDAAIFGAKWQKEQDDKDLSEKIAAAYQLGLADKEKQMMKEAVEADIMLTLHDKTGDISLHTGYLPKELGIKYGDKVHIIIVKEDLL